MQFSTILSTMALLATVVTAFPSRRDSCMDTCGSTCYYQSDIDDAVNRGYSDYQSGNKDGTGSGAYPHTYNNYEGFDFPVNGPYQEFPILSSYQVYTGGSPGPDRIVFNTNGELAGVVTHTGASGNDFVACNAS